jgi:hypothetical protein
MGKQEDSGMESPAKPTVPIGEIKIAIEREAATPSPAKPAPGAVEPIGEIEAAIERNSKTK